jgi:precorrin-2/cobalt-factor-2 C20-methyltransferase
MAMLYAIGVGPGDPELVTRKAERILRRVDVILAPVAKPGETSLALETAREFLDEQRQEIVIRPFPMTSDPERLIPAWQEAAAFVAGKMADGKDVAFITIGDPLLYSTFIYLLRIFREQYPQFPLEIVPGISSVMTAAALAGVPLAEGDERLAIIPATIGVEAICEALARHETVVLLKVRPLFAEILELLKQSGRSNSTVFIERAGTIRQKVIRNLSEMASHTPDYLSLMIIKRP